LHNRYTEKKNLISRSIISSVNNNDREALHFSILLNLYRYAHSHIYIYIYIKLAPYCIEKRNNIMKMRVKKLLYVCIPYYLK